ncbi:hypothetical protein [Paenibacillus glacialis]|uniref:hypothetical protein n=1 Tax=Paenibacillus glacialis TaxID=494026 RepID=UPI001FE09F2E|nr:hypothetical protein [Paenibacillus glacialis]
MNSSSVTLLLSVNSLGAYIPAMHLHTHLQGRGVGTDVHVLENLYHEEAQHKIRSTKKAFHADFFVTYSLDCCLLPVSAGSSRQLKISEFYPTLRKGSANVCRTLRQPKASPR